MACVARISVARGDQVGSCKTRGIRASNIGPYASQLTRAAELPREVRRRGVAAYSENNPEPWLCIELGSREDEGRERFSLDSIEVERAISGALSQALDIWDWWCGLDRASILLFRQIA